MPTVDLDALAAQYGGQSVQDEPAAPNNLDALAQQYGGSVTEAPVEPAPKAVMPWNDFRQAYIAKIRAGTPVGEIQEWAKSVGLPDDESGSARYSIPNIDQKIVDYYSRNPNVPINMPMREEPNWRDKLETFGRGAMDSLLFKGADELEAMVRSGEISGPDYEAAVAQQRALRARDAIYSPVERLFGEATGTIGQGALMAAAPIPAALQGGNLAVRIGKGATAGAAGSTLNSLGAAQSMDEFSERAAGDATIGAVQGSSLPVVGAVAGPVLRELRTIFSSDYAANRALADSGIDFDRVQQAAQEFFKREGRQPALAEVLTPFESGQLTRALSRSGKAAERIQARAEEYVQDARSGIRDWVGAPSNLDRPDLGIPPVQAGKKPFNNDDFIEESILRAENPEGLRQRADVIADRAFAPFRQEGFAVTDKARTVLERAFPKLEGVQFDDIKALYEKNEMTLGDMDLLRRALNKRAKADRADADNLRNNAIDIADLMAEQQPKTREAVANMAKFMRAADGAEVGAYGVKPGTEIGDFVSAMYRLTDLERPGVASGAREGLVAMTRGKASDIENFARRLTENGGNNGYFDRIANTTSPQEARTLLQTATRFKTGIDSLAALAKIPDDKVASTLDSVEGIVKLMAAPVSGGAAKASIANAILDRTTIGKDAADKLAERLLNPAKRQEAIAAVGNLTGKGGRKLYRDARNVLRGALFSFSMQIGKDNARMPEGFVGVGTEPNE